MFSLLPQEKYLQLLRRRLIPEEDLNTQSSSSGHCPKQIRTGAHTHMHPLTLSIKPLALDTAFRSTYIHPLSDTGKMNKAIWSHVHL